MFLLRCSRVDVSCRQVSLHIISLDNAASGRQDEKQLNLRVLDELKKEVKHKQVHVQTPAELLGLFKCKEYSNTAYYAGPFTIGNMMTIRVKVMVNCTVSSAHFSCGKAIDIRSCPPCSLYTVCMFHAGSQESKERDLAFNKSLQREVEGCRC